MGVFDLCFRGDPDCGSHQGKGSSPSLLDGNGGLGLGQEGGCQVALGYKGNVVFNHTCQLPHIKDPESGSQGNEAPLCQLRLS